MRKRHIIRVVGSLAAALFFCAGHGAAAQDLGAIKDCRAIGDADERLQCFNDATAFLDEAGALASAEAPPAMREEGRAPSGETVAAVDDSFGAEDLPKEETDDSFGAEDLASKEREEDKKELRALLTGLQFTRSGKYIITLDNGQVWRQIPGDSETLVLPRATSEGVPVILKKGLFGSHFLRLRSSKRSIRVERIE